MKQWIFSYFRPSYGFWTHTQKKQSLTHIVLHFIMMNDTIYMKRTQKKNMEISLFIQIYLWHKLLLSFSYVTHVLFVLFLFNVTYTTTTIHAPINYVFPVVLYEHSHEGINVPLLLPLDVGFKCKCNEGVVF